MVQNCGLDMHIRYTQLRENDIVPIRYNSNKAGTSRDIKASLCVKEVTCLLVIYNVLQFSSILTVLVSYIFAYLNITSHIKIRTIYNL